MDAPSREAVFADLRARGIKAIKVVAADGSKANGEVRGMRKGTVAALVAVAAACAGVVAYIGGGRTAAAPGAAAAAPRHQIYGDPAIMDGLERGDFGAILPRDGDRMLAVFAQPGRLMCRDGFNPQWLSAEQLEAFSRYAREELAPERDLPVDTVLFSAVCHTASPREERELGQIVNGMREEMRGYLANGNGTPRSFWRRLNERTLQELQIYERTRRELEKESSPQVWEEKNAALRRLGLRTIPSPNE